MKTIKMFIVCILSFSMLVSNFPVNVLAVNNENEDLSIEVNYELLNTYEYLENDEKVTVTKFNVDGIVIYYKVKGNTIETFDENMNTLGVTNVTVTYNEPNVFEESLMTLSNIWDTYDVWAGYYPYVSSRIELSPSEIALGITVGLIVSKMYAYYRGLQFVFGQALYEAAATTILEEVILSKVIETSVWYNYNRQCRILRRETLYAVQGSANGISPNDDSVYQIYWTANPNDYTQPTACRMLEANPEYDY